MTNAKNGASAPTAKPCLRVDVDASKSAIDGVLDYFLETMTNGFVSNGEFEGEEADRELICDIVAARAGLKSLCDELGDTFQDLEAKTAKLESLETINSRHERRISMLELGIAIPGMHIIELARFCGASVDDVRNIYREVTGCQHRNVSCLDLQAFIKGLLLDRAKLQQERSRSERLARAQAEEVALVEPAPGENPEAAAYAKINAKNGEGAETVIIDGEKVQLFGNQDAIDYLLGAAGTTGGCEWKAA